MGKEATLPDGLRNISRGKNELSLKRKCQSGPAYMNLEVRKWFNSGCPLGSHQHIDDIYAITLGVKEHRTQNGDILDKWVGETNIAICYLLCI